MDTSFLRVDWLGDQHAWSLRSRVRALAAVRSSCVPTKNRVTCDYKNSGRWLSVMVVDKDENRTEISRTEPFSILDPIQFVFSCSTLPFSFSYFRCFVFKM